MWLVTDERTKIDTIVVSSNRLFVFVNNAGVEDSKPHVDSDSNWIYTTCSGNKHPKKFIEQSNSPKLTS